MRFFTVLSITWFLLLGVGFSNSASASSTGGVGMEILQLYDHLSKNNTRGPVVVLGVFPGSPADLNGIEKGDIITHIDGKATSGSDFEETLLTSLRGIPGSKLDLILRRPSTGEILIIVLERIQISY